MSSPIRGNGFINGVQLNQVENSLTLVQAFFPMWFLRLVLNYARWLQPLFMRCSLLSDHEGKFVLESVPHNQH